MHTTLNKIMTKHHSHDARDDDWETLLKSLNKTQADDEPLSLITVLDSNGIDYAVWCLRAVDGYVKEKQLLMVFAARKLQNLFSKIGIDALDIIEKYVHGLASEQELENAYSAAANAAVLSKASDNAAFIAVSAASRAAAGFAYDAAVAAAVAADQAHIAASIVADIAAGDVYVTVARACLNFDSVSERNEFRQSIETKFRELFEDR